MINLTYWQLAIIAAVYLVISTLIKFGFRLLRTSQWFMMWAHRRDLARKAKIKKTQQQELIEKFQCLEQFCNWLSHQLKNRKERKQFTEEFFWHQAKRSFWINKLMDSLKPKEEVSNESGEIKDESQGNS